VVVGAGRGAEGVGFAFGPFGEVKGITIHAARKAVARYRAGRIPVATTPGLAPKTVKNVHRMIHLALATAVAWRYIDYNPAEHAALPRESRKGIRKRGTT
jgi:hypothetical protein